MAKKIRTLTLTEKQSQELWQYRDHDPKVHVRERCAALLKNCLWKNRSLGSPEWVIEAA
jgi:hypothetical protein